MLKENTIRVLIIDNYDSFTFNLYQLFGSIDSVKVEVVRNDEISINEIVDNLPDCIVLSPGPGNPKNKRDFGVCTEVITELKTIVPILGVCLGHQGMGYLLNAKIINAPRILHGKTSIISHNQSGIFANIPDHIKVARYHSLILEEESIPDSITITARTSQNEVMAIQHRDYPLFGVQFHPESFMTEYGIEMVQNFIALTESFQLQAIEV